MVSKNAFNIVKYNYKFNTGVFVFYLFRRIEVNMQIRYINKYIPYPEKYQ